MEIVRSVWIQRDSARGLDSFGVRWFEPEGCILPEGFWFRPRAFESIAPGSSEWNVMRSRTS